MAGRRIIGGVRTCVDTGTLCIPVGPSLTIAITDGDRANRWQLAIDVELEGTGSFRLGTVTTVAPAAAPPAGRIVAMAYCPGAVRWRVFATRTAGPAHSQAELELSMSGCCPSFVGVVPVPPFAAVP